MFKFREILGEVGCLFVVWQVFVVIIVVALSYVLEDYIFLVGSLLFNNGEKYFDMVVLTLGSAVMLVLTIYQVVEKEVNNAYKRLKDVKGSQHVDDEEKRHVVTLCALRKHPEATYFKWKLKHGTN